MNFQKGLDIDQLNYIAKEINYIVREKELNNKKMNIIMVYENNKGEFL